MFSVATVLVAAVLLVALRPAYGECPTLCECAMCEGIKQVYCKYALLAGFLFQSAASLNKCDASAPRQHVCCSVDSARHGDASPVGPSDRQLPKVV